MNFSPAINVAVAIGNTLRSIGINNNTSALVHFNFAWEDKIARWDVLAALATAIATLGPEKVQQCLNDCPTSIEGFEKSVKELVV